MEMEGKFLKEKKIYKFTLQNGDSYEVHYAI